MRDLIVESVRRDELTPLTRTRTAYGCFFVWGAFVISFSSISLFTTGVQQDGAAAVLGIYGGLPAMIALVIGTFHALTVWRVRLIQILLLATVLLFGAVALDAVISTRWTAIIAAGYGLFVIGVSVRSLTGFGIPATFSIVVAVVGCLIFGATTGNFPLVIAGLLIVPIATFKWKHDRN